MPLIKENAPHSSAIRARVLLSFCCALLACAEGTSKLEVSPSPVEFVDVATAAGLDFEHVNGFSGDYFYVETAGSGGGFVDYDGDGLLDVLFSTYASSMVMKARQWSQDSGKLGQPVLQRQGAGNAL